MKSDAFCEQVVIITGASSGIGKWLALLLANQGAKVAIAARRAERLEEVAAECRLRGGEVLVVPTDVSDEGQCKNLIEKTVAAFGRLDMLINNAGMAVVALLREYPDLHLFRHVIDVNFYGAVHCTYYALPHIMQSRGRIVAVSSLGGKGGLPFNTSYTASKYALHGFYDSLRMEMHPHGVSVSVICPYWVVTEFHEAYLDKNGQPRGKQGRALYTKKMMTAERCAAITLEAAYKRKRELLMGPGGLLVWLKLLAPNFLDRMSINLILKPIAKRTKAGKIEA
ncbi:MAG TPA: SDR family oxidoreductase [Anaerolineales bacterium]|nr:short chain dehydrogenase [Anaerolineae bacterium]HRJ58615.1 SDR family oxidoreductase [Anaerolineales bacterium]HRK90115.1 SDR family oxidoreductase [Anaerolineales bacterium]